MLVTINGLEIKISATDDVTQRWRNSGQQMLSACGFSSDSTRLVRKCWRVTSCFADCESAEALLGLLQGRGLFLRYANGLDGSNGITPSNAADGLIWSPGAGPFGQVGFLEVQTPSANALTYPVQAGDQWTIFWREGPNWDGFALTSEGNYYQNGVLSGPANPAVILDPTITASGDLNLETLEVGQFAHVVFLRYLATEDQLEQFSLSQAQGAAFSDLPYLRLGGELFCDEECDGLGFINGQTIEKISLSAGAAAFKVEFDLCCVDAEYACLDNYDLFTSEPEVTEDIGGLAFVATSEQGDVIDPQNVAEVLGPGGPAGVDELVWGTFNSAGELDWFARTNSLTADAFGLGPADGNVFQMEDGSLVITARCGGEAQILSPTGVVLATVPERSFEAIIAFRVSSDGNSLIWGPKELHFETSTVPDTQSFIFNSLLAVNEQETVATVGTTYACNGTNMTGTFGVGDAGWELAGPTFPDISQVMHPVTNDQFQRLPFRVGLNLVTGDPLWISIDGPRPNNRNMGESTDPRTKPLTLTKDPTRLATIFAGSVNTDSFGADLFNADITIPPTGNNQSNTFHFHNYQTGETEFLISQQPRQTVQIVAYGGTYVDENGNSYMTSPFVGGALVYDHTRHPTAAAANLAVQARAEGIFSFDTNGELRWVTRIAQDAQGLRQFQNGIWPAANGDILVLLGVTTQPGANITIDPPGFNQFIDMDTTTGNRGDITLLVRLNKDTGAILNTTIVGDIVDRLATFQESNRDVAQQRGICVRPSGEILAMTGAQIPAAGSFTLTLGSGLNLIRPFPGVGEHQSVVCVHDANTMDLTGFIHLINSQSINARVRFHAR